MPTSNSRIIWSDQLGWIGNNQVAIINRQSGRALTVQGGRDDNGAGIIQRVWNDNPQQRWCLEQTGGDYYRIVIVDNGKCLDVSNQSKANGATIQLWDMPTRPTSSGDSSDSERTSQTGGLVPDHQTPALRMSICLRRNRPRRATPHPTIILSDLVQYWTAIYSDLTEDADIPFAAASGA